MKFSSRNISRKKVFVDRGRTKKILLRKTFNTYLSWRGKYGVWVRKSLLRSWLPCLSGDLGSAAVGEVIACEREPRNTQDRYAVAVKKDGTVIGHLPRKLSRVCSLFVRTGGNIRCTVTGRRRYSADLHQGGLEIPCLLLFYIIVEPKELAKLKRLLK